MKFEVKNIGYAPLILCDSDLIHCTDHSLAVRRHRKTLGQELRTAMFRIQLAGTHRRENRPKRIAYPENKRRETGGADRFWGMFRSWYQNPTYVEASPE